MTVTVTGSAVVAGLAWVMRFVIRLRWRAIRRRRRCRRRWGFRRMFCRQAGNAGNAGNRSTKRRSLQSDAEQGRAAALPAGKAQAHTLVYPGDPSVGGDHDTWGGRIKIEAGASAASAADCCPTFVEGNASLVPLLTIVRMVPLTPIEASGVWIR
jgi:hypothetical protein